MKDRDELENNRPHSRGARDDCRKNGWNYVVRDVNVRAVKPSCGLICFSAGDATALRFIAGRDWDAAVVQGVWRTWLQPHRAELIQMGFTQVQFLHIEQGPAHPNGAAVIYLNSSQEEP